MAKIKMTRKAITQNFSNIRCAGFCDLQNPAIQPRAGRVYMRSLRLEF